MPEEDVPKLQPSDFQRRLRFPTLPKTSAADVLYVDEAIDRIGQQRAPEQWRTIVPGPGHLSGSNFVQANTLGRTEKTIKLLSPKQRALLRRVRSELISAVETGGVPAYLLDEGGKRVDLGADLLHAQAKTWFEKGYILSGGQRRLVLFERHGFEQWLNGEIAKSKPSEQPTPGEPKRRKTRPLGPKFAERVCKILNDYAMESGHRYTQPEIKLLLDEARSNVAVSEEQVRSLIWKVLPTEARNPGRRPVESETDKARRILLPQLRAAYRPEGSR